MFKHKWEFFTKTGLKKAHRKEYAIIYPDITKQLLTKNIFTDKIFLEGEDFNG